MNNKMRTKIIDHYAPQQETHVPLCYYLNSSEQQLSAEYEREVTLTFGGTDRYKTDTRALFILLFPEAWENEIKKRFVDEKTEHYLEGVIKSIGLQETVYAEDEGPKFSKITNTETYLNAAITYGKDIDNRWMIQREINGGDHVHVISSYYTHQPSSHHFKATLAFEKARDFFMKKGYHQGTFNCSECGNDLHWTHVASAGIEAK